MCICTEHVSCLQKEYTYKSFEKGCPPKHKSIQYTTMPKGFVGSGCLPLLDQSLWRFSPQEG